MGCFRACEVLVLYRLFSCILGVQGTLKVVEGDSSLLKCGPQSLQVSLPLHPDGNASFTAKGKDGVSYSLQNDSVCGTWVSWQPDGSVVIGADYAGCYVTEKDGEYMMTLDHEEVSAGQPIHQEKQLRCPVLPAMDAPSLDLCAAVSTVDRMACGSVPITQDVCQVHGCCYNPRDSVMPCYFGNPVTALCTADGQATIAISTAATVPSLNLASVRLLTVNSACSGLSVKQTRAFLVYQFPLSCGSVYQVIDDATVYENRLEASNGMITWNGASISRDSPFRLTVRCSFTSSSSFIPLTVDVFTLPPPLPVASPGPLALEMRIARDAAYSSYYTDADYPVVKLLREPVYVEVRVLQRMDPNLVLVLNQCWATPSSNPEQRPQWPILVQRCPYDGDNYRTQMVPIVSMLQFLSHYQRFAVSTFTFVDNFQQNLQGQIYFHCSASVCVPSALGSCSTVCPSRRKRMTEGWDMEHLNLVTAEGPVYFDSKEEDYLLLEGITWRACSAESSRLSSVPEWARGAVQCAGVERCMEVLDRAGMDYKSLTLNDLLLQCENKGISTFQKGNLSKSGPAPASALVEHLEAYN